MIPDPTIPPTVITTPDPTIPPTVIATSEPTPLPTVIATPDPKIPHTVIATPDPAIPPTVIATPDPTIPPTVIALQNNLPDIRTHFAPTKRPQPPGTSYDSTSTQTTLQSCPSPHNHWKTKALQTLPSQTTDRIHTY